jgi:hypothetical protein
VFDGFIDELLDDSHNYIDNDQLNHDDGSFEEEYQLLSSDYAAVHFEADAGERINTLKWYQIGDGGAFYINIWEDNNGMPADTAIYSVLQAAGNKSGWNEIEVDIAVSGNFFVGAKGFSTTRPLGLDSSTDSGNSYENTDGEWTEIDGNLSFRASLSCV